MEALAEPPTTCKDIQTLQRLDGGQGGCGTPTQCPIDSIHGSLVQRGESLGFGIVALGDEKPILTRVFLKNTFSEKNYGDTPT